METVQKFVCRDWSKNKNSCRYEENYISTMNLEEDLSKNLHEIDIETNLYNCYVLFNELLNITKESYDEKSPVNITLTENNRYDFYYYCFENSK